MKNIDWGFIFNIVVTFVVIGLIVLAVAFLVSNESNRLSEGVVVDKSFSSGYSSVSGDRDDISAYSRGDSYQLCISGEKNGKVVRYWFECTELEYTTYKVGDYYKK